MMGQMERKNTPHPVPSDLIKQAAAGALPSLASNAPTPTAAHPIEVWQIVVVGNIDLRQHHPYWYRQIEAITESEMAAAIKSLQALIVPTPPGAPPQATFLQFDIGEFIVNVIADRWIIQTDKEAVCPRMVAVASLVFKKLWEISITAFGVNRTWTLKLSTVTAAQFLGDRLRQTDLALPAGKSSGQFFFADIAADFTTNYTLLPSPVNDKSLLVTYNRHHAIVKAAGKPNYFDLGDLINGCAESDWKSAIQYRAELERCVVKAEETRNAV
jgi:hypothetical protein